MKRKGLIFPGAEILLVLIGLMFFITNLLISEAAREYEAI